MSSMTICFSVLARDQAMEGPGSAGWAGFQLDRTKPGPETSGRAGFQLNQTKLGPEMSGWAGIQRNRSIEAPVSTGSAGGLRVGRVRRLFLQLLPAVVDGAVVVLVNIRLAAGCQLLIQLAAKEVRMAC